MITVNLLLPFARNILKISCDEDASTDRLLELIREQTPSGEGPERRWICHIDGRYQLRHDHTLTECGVTDGSNLIMI